MNLRSTKAIREPRPDGTIRTPERARELQAIGEQRILTDLTRTREYINAHSYQAASHVVGIMNGGESTQMQMKAAESILDRSVGKAPAELRVGPSDMATSIVLELAQRELSE